MAQIISKTVIGNGMIAKAFSSYLNFVVDVVVFASGVSDSTCTNNNEFDREIKLLHQAIDYCQSNKKRIIYFSSAGEVYGDCSKEKNEESILDPKTLYGLHKIKCEQEIIKTGVDYLILRLPNVVGFNQNRKQLVPFLTDQAIYGKVVLYSNATRVLLDIDDMAALTVNIVNKMNYNQIINLASGVSVPVTRLFDEIQTILGTHAQIKIKNGGIRHNFSINKLANITNHVFCNGYWQLVLNKYITPMNSEY